MIDIHTHILPGIDDGSDSMETSLEMLAIAAECGVEALVATPHCNIPGSYENYQSHELESLWERLKANAMHEEIPIRLYRGMEIFATQELPELLSRGRVWTINHTKYFLTEFAFDEDPAFCWDILQQCRSRGFRPIIAHPERYFFIQEEPEIAYEYCRAGYGLQLNKGSFQGRFGRQARITAELLTEHGLAACVASDAHSTHQRTTHMEEIRDYLTQVYDERYTHLLLEENPRRILFGRELLGFEPIPFR